MSLDKYIKYGEALELIDSLKTSGGEKRYLKYLLNKYMDEPSTRNMEMLKGRLVRTMYEDRRNQKVVMEILDLLGIP